MDHFFIKLLLLEESAIIGVAILLMVVGGLLAARIFDVGVAFRRVTYLWWIAGLYLLLMLSQFGWSAVPAAADAGLLSALVIMLLGTFALFGAGIYYGSAARSNDIGGDTSRAWLGFVPFANLWLIFSGRKDVIPSRAPRSKVARWVLDPMLVIGALFIVAFSQGVEEVLEDTPAYDVADSQALVDLINQSQTLEESFEMEAEASGSQVPIRIDDITTLTDIRADGRTLHMRYDIAQQISGFRPGFEATLAIQFCDPEMFAADLGRGGTIAIEYYGPDGRLIQGYEITQSDCNA
ncbi:hypothetical protein FIU97_02175 [Roseivivax sp. THAF40]|uniref:hypothetical protein n=1 Tax=Roseivivax sp. THAF40 TaxID=2587858 RepID=UPI0012693BA1|nr:hypothetical protein [Roseivivax sp. THAF40]QFT45372.1 hypothetical protein FIU97_02175 [Roseivivax sp. THAF40]